MLFEQSCIRWSLVKPDDVISEDAQSSNDVDRPSSSPAPAPEVITTRQSPNKSLDDC